MHGRAEYLIKSLELNNQSYNNAKELLHSAFASTSLQKYNTVKMFSELKLKPSDEPFSYIGKVKSLMENLKLLNMTGEEFAQYFVWEGLNDSFKQHLISITNNVRPSLDDILKYFFEASERYNQDSKIMSKTSDKAKHDKMSSTGLAVSVEKSEKQKGCFLCSSDGKNSIHKVSACEAFKTPEAKLKHLKDLGRCLKCSGLGHMAKKLQF